MDASWGQDSISWQVPDMFLHLWFRVEGRLF